MERQNEAIAARNAALEADAAKSNFIATMSHELRTPLNAILGFSDVIRQEIMGPLGHHKYREYIEDIHFSAEALKEMVDDVLNISRVDLNGFEFHDEEYDIVAHSDSIVRRFMPIAKNRNIQLLTTVDEDFPRFLVGDPRVQQHIQNNLLSNAIKFSRDGGTVRIAFQTAGAEEIMISISDSGHGMSEDLIERLGEPFLRENKPHIAKGTQDGVGLGFYITKSLVEARGGRIEVESELGVGTVVRAIYPRSAFPQPPSTTRSRSDDTPDEVLAG
jgi:signal transduction histidine kinase